MNARQETAYYKAWHKAYYAWEPEPSSAIRFGPDELWCNWRHKETGEVRWAKENPGLVEANAIPRPEFSA